MTTIERKISLIYVALISKKKTNLTTIMLNSLDKTHFIFNYCI